MSKDIDHEYEFVSEDTRNSYESEIEDLLWNPWIVATAIGIGALGAVAVPIIVPIISPISAVNIFTMVALGWLDKQPKEPLPLYPPECEEPSDVLLEKARNQLGIDHVNHFNFAVCGASGVGKSTFINSFLQLQGADLAKVGVTETTDQIKRYTSPKYPNIVFWDIPGAGTLNHPAATYFKDKKLYSFDCILILTSDRFLEVDVQIAIEATNWKKKFAMVRTKADVSLKNKAYDMSWEGTMAELAPIFREELKNSLKAQKNVPEKALLFIICSRMYRVRDRKNWYENETDHSLKGMDEKLLLAHILQSIKNRLRMPQM